MHAISINIHAPNNTAMAIIMSSIFLEYKATATRIAGVAILISELSQETGINKSLVIRSVLLVRHISPVMYFMFEKKW